MVVEVGFTPPAAQQDFARQVRRGLEAHLDLEARLISVRRASAVSAQLALGDSVPAVFAPPVLALDQAASARLERALRLSHGEDLFLVVVLPRAVRSPLTQ